MYLTYAAPRGHALIDRALYLPKSWAEDSDRCDDAGIPAEQRGFATKPTLATALIDRAVQPQVPAAWVAGDEVYGADPTLRAAVRGHGLGYVLAVAANRRVPTHAGPIRVDALPALLPARAWQKHSAGAGAHGPRLYSWAWFRLLAEDDTDTGVHHLLIRRNDATGEHAYLRCYSPRPVPLRTLVARRRPALAHRGILPSRQRPGRTRPAPGPALDVLAPLDHPGHARPRLPGRGHRHRTRHPPHPDRPDHVDRQRVSPTLRRAAARPPTTPSPPCWPGHDGDDNTNTEPANPTTDDANNQ